MRILRVIIALIAAPIAWVLAIPALVAALPFVCVANLTRWIANRISPSAVPWEDLIKYEPVIGWRAKGNLDAFALDFNGDPFHVVTDADGWRGAGTIDEADIVCFGDSFAFGSGIDDDRFFANLGAASRIKAIGAPGYSLVQSFMWMRELQDRLRGKLIIWLVYPANDLDDNLLPNMEGYRMPFLRQKEGEWSIHTEHVRPEPWTISSQRQNVDRVVEIGAGTPRTDRVVEGFRWLLDEAVAVCEAAGAGLVVATVPDLAPLSANAVAEALASHPHGDRFDPDRSARLIADACRDAGVEFLDLARYLNEADYLEHDVHWNARGHAKVARVLAECHAAARRPDAAEVDAGLAIASAGGGA